jgi:DNA-binding transcriptional ArsR family regulator
MEIDRKTLKALSADTRLDILKSLGRRRKMPSELSKELNLAVSTVSEHLDRLEEADLVRREETGHKWIYYSLTQKGESLIKPRYPIQFVIVLSIGLMFIFSGFIKYFYFTSFNALEAQVTRAPAVTGGAEVAKVMQVPSTDWLLIGLLVTGIVLVILSLVIKRRR